MKIIHDICFIVDLEIEGLNPSNALIWAYFNSVRHFNALLKILDSRPPNGPVNILNASGCSNGTQAFSLCSCLQALDIDYSSQCIESPRSPYLEKVSFKDYCHKFSIEFIFHDYSETFAIDLPFHDYDIVLFTEIAEHLDHTSFLGSLQVIRDCLALHGCIFLITPNLLRLTNRIKFLVGSSTSLYWGDGTLNVIANSYGHITLYAIDRLVLLLRDSGFEVLEAVTTNYGLPPYPSHQFLKPLILTICSFFSNFLPNSKDSI